MAGNVGAVVAGVRAARRRQHLGPTSVHLMPAPEEPSVRIVEYPPRSAATPPTQRLPQQEQQQKVGRRRTVVGPIRKATLPLPFRKGMESLYAARLARELEEAARKKEQQKKENPFCLPEDLNSEASVSTADTANDRQSEDPMIKSEVLLEPTEPFARYLSKVLGRGPVTGIFYPAPGKPGLTRFRPESCRRLPFVNGMVLVVCFENEEPADELEEELLLRPSGCVGCSNVPGCTIL